MENPFKYTVIRSIEKGERCNVYDLTMAPGTEPAFVANGLVVHNSFNTADAAVTTFMENVLALRNFMTHKVFTSTLFPLVALANGLYKKDAKVGKLKSPADVMFDLAHHKDLDIPKLLWTKDLVGTDAPSRLEMLEKLSEKGFPVALRTWASAAGLDVGALLNDVKEDAELLKTIEAIRQASGGAAPESNLDTYDEVAMRRAVKVLSGGLQRRGLGVRSMDPDVHTLSKTGKKRSVYNERAHMRKENELLVRATIALQNPEHRAKVRARVLRQYKGGIPNFLQGGVIR